VGDYVTATTRGRAVPEGADEDEHPTLRSATTTSMPSGSARPIRGPRPPDVICQTGTLADPGADATVLFG
jgi:hypothetical protein